MTAEERIDLYIYPKVAETEAEITALALAVSLQEDYETAIGGILAIGPISSASNEGVSVTYKPDADSFNSSISPDAREVLRRYGLLPEGFPRAVRI